MRLNIDSVKNKMLWFLLPIISIAVAVMTILAFFISNNMLSNQFNTQMDSVRSNAVRTMEQIHSAYNMLDIQLEEDMSLAVLDFKNRYEEDYPEKSLEDIKKDMDNLYDLIVIDHETTIVDATMPEALGFNFVDFDEALGEKMRSLFRSEAVVHEKIRTNVATGFLTKFSYVSSDDSSKIFEIVYNNNRFTDTLSNLDPIETMNALVATNQIVSAINVYDVYGYRFTNQGNSFEPTDASFGLVERAISEGSFEDNDGNIRRSVVYLKDSRPSVLSDHSKIIEIQFDYQAMAALNRQISAIVFGSGTLIGLLTIAASYFGISRITKPISEFSEASIRISNGDYTARVDEIRQDELGRLAKVFNMMAVNIDHTNLDKSNQIEYLSYHDQLTGLYNRHYYELCLAQMNHSGVLPLSLVMIDVNGLKLINDAFGHKAGDSLLKETTKLIDEMCDEKDLFMRIGGDEFVILMPNTDEIEAQERLDGIKKRIEQNEGDRIIRSISSGVATRRLLMEPMDEVFKIAEEHMYRDKLTKSIEMRSRQIEKINQILRAENPDERKHAERVKEISIRFAKKLNLSDESIEMLINASLMHDIGKIIIDKSLLNKNRTYSLAEKLELERHSEIGYQILKSVNAYALISEIVLAHHEKWNGSGYPQGLVGEEIPFLSRVLAISNFCEQKIDKEKSIEEANINDLLPLIQPYAGVDFDPVLIEKLFL